MKKILDMIVTICPIISHYWLLHHQFTINDNNAPYVTCDAYICKFQYFCKCVILNNSMCSSLISGCRLELCALVGAVQGPELL